MFAANVTVSTFGYRTTAALTDAVNMFIRTSDREHGIMNQFVDIYERYDGTIVVAPRINFWAVDFWENYIVEIFIAIKHIAPCKVWHDKDTNVWEAR